MNIRKVKDILAYVIWIPAIAEFVLLAHRIIYDKGWEDCIKYMADEFENEGYVLTKKNEGVLTRALFFLKIFKGGKVKWTDTGH